MLNLVRTVPPASLFVLRRSTTWYEWSKKLTWNRVLFESWFRRMAQRKWSSNLSQNLCNQSMDLSRCHPRSVVLDSREESCRTSEFDRLWKQRLKKWSATLTYETFWFFIPFPIILGLSDNFLTKTEVNNLSKQGVKEETFKRPEGRIKLQKNYLHELLQTVQNTSEHSQKCQFIT